MYLTGKYIADTSDGVAWGFCGIFSSKEKAIAACKDEMYFYAPVTIDKEAPGEAAEFEEIIYPHGDEHDDESS